MGWDSSTQILTAPFTKIALNGQGDLQLALGRTTCFSEIQLVGNVDANGDDLGYLKMQKFAKWQPFSYPSVYYNRYKDCGSIGSVAASSASTNRLAGLMSRAWGFYPISSSGTIGSTVGIKLYSSLTTLNNPLKNDLDNFAAGEHWNRERPKGGSYGYYRALDLDGYTARMPWSLGNMGGTSDNLQYGFPFGGHISFPYNAGRYDTIRMSISTGDSDNPTESWDSGDHLLYPSDFRRMSDFIAGYPNLLDWYLGVVLQDTASNNYYLITSPNKLSVAYANNIDDAYFEAQFPSGAGTNVAFYIVPILSSEAHTSWISTNMSGSIMTIDGYRSRLNYSSNKMGLSLFAQNDTPKVVNGNTVINFKLTNGWNTNNTIRSLYVFLVADGVFDSNDWDTVREIVENWSDQYSSDYGNTSKMVDIKNGSGKIIARCYNVLSEIGSSTLAGGRVITWTKTISGITGDGLSNQYNKWTEICVCANTSLDGYISIT